jgi:tetratricopeptide (TPR) repeat protein
MPSAPEHLVIGKQLGHYEILSLLGKGGMGEVYVARDMRLEREVALKILPPGLAEDPERRQRFEREAKTVAALRHPNIVTIHSIEEAGGTRFLTMELIEGSSLSSRVRPGGLELKALLDIAIPLADAVGAAHARGITHRDLKPANILIDDQDRIMVLDFGVAKLQPAEGPVGGDATRVEMDSLTQQGKIVGTVHYMSPEQAEGKSVDARSDVFSLGILLYELATGKKPYSGDTALSVLSSILKDDPVPVTELNLALPRQIGRILKRCLEKDPSRRYSSATDLRIELEALREEVTGLGLSASGSSAATGIREEGATAAPSAGRAGLIFSPRALLGMLAVVVVIGSAVMFGPRLFGESSQTEVNPSATELTSRRAGVGASGRPSIAVFRFEDHSGDQEIRWLSSGLPNMLLTGLAQTPGLDVVSSQRVDDILGQIGRSDAQKIDRSILEALAQRSGAGAVVLGSIFKAGDTIRIDVQVEDVATGKLLFARSATGEDVFPLVDQLAADIRDGLSVDSEVQPAPVGDVTTTNLAAWRAYEEGERARLALRLPDALDAYERALQLDPQFAMVHVRLAGVNSRLGRSDEATRHANLAYENLDRLPPRQRALVEADRAANDDKDIPRAIAILEETIARFPDEIDAYTHLNFLRGQTQGDAEAANEVLERGVEANPHSPSLRNSYAYSLRALGRYPDAIREFETYQRLEPDEANPYDSLGELYLVAGQPERSVENYTKALDLDADFLTAYQGRALAKAALGRFDEALTDLDRQEESARRRDLDAVGAEVIRMNFYLRLGRFDDAQAAAGRYVDLRARLDEEPDPVRRDAVMSYVAYARGDHAGCIESAGRGASKVDLEGDPFAGSELCFFYEVEGMSEIAQGNPDRAMALADELDSHPQHPVTRFYADWLRGAAELAKGDLDRAEALFRGVQPLGKRFFSNNQTIMRPMMRVQNPQLRDWEARLLEARGILDGAVAKYRQLNRPGIENVFVSIYEPRYVLQTARLLDRMGDRPAATDAYRKFLEYWKDADEGRPELAEARQYLAANPRGSAD